MIRPDMEAIPARDAFLLIAAAVADGMPVPTEVRITDDYLTLAVASLSDGRRWLAWLGANLAEVRDKTYASEGRQRVRLQHSAMDQWQGRWVTVIAADECLPAPVESEAADKVRAAAAEVAA